MPIANVPSMHLRALKRPALSLCLLGLGCGAQPDTRAVTGHIDLAAFGKSTASLVAVHPDGTLTSVAVTSDGRFTIPLAVGKSASLAFRDPESGTRFAQLVFEDKGTKSPRVLITPGADLNVGEVHRVIVEQAGSSPSSAACTPTGAGGGTTETGGGGTTETGGGGTTETGGGNNGGGTTETGGTAGGGTTAGGTQTGGGTPVGGGTSPGTLFSRRISFLVSADVDLSQACQSDDSDHSGDALEDRDQDGRPDGLDDDVDNDGTCEDNDGSGGDSERLGNADLECNMSPALGSTFQLEMAFLAKGSAPAEIVSVEMEGGGSWRLAELQANAPFVVTQDDCSHDGNRDRGRDRMIVSWKNADGSVESDHLDLKYCD
ncbi:MAG: hypothetical protein U1E65_02350 [Myxococcota bacterium]